MNQVNGRREHEIPPVLPWDHVELAARELFTIWTDHHDLRWAQAAWALLPHCPSANTDSGIDRAHSLVTLVALALISAQVAEVACDEVGHDPTYSAVDAMERLDLESFYLGQIYSEEPPVCRDGTVSIRGIVGELAMELTRPLISLFRSFYPSDAALLRFFLILRGEPDDDGNEVVSQLADRISMDAVVWATNGCPIWVIRS